MATTKETPKTNSNGGTAPERDKGRWAEIQTDRALYSGDKGKGDTVVGYLLALLRMPPVLDKPWSAFVVRLTEPCHATRMKDGTKTSLLCQPGEEILVPMNHDFNHIIGHALNERYAFEVMLKPEGQIRTKNGSKTVWRMRVNPTPIQRDGHMMMLAKSSHAPQLGAGAPIDAAGEDIPF